MAVLMASQTRSVLSASRMVLPMRISEAIAAEWVMPEQPMVSTSASSMTPFLMFRRQLAGALLRCAPADAVGKPEMSLISFACTHLPSSGMGAGP